VRRGIDERVLLGVTDGVGGEAAMPTGLRDRVAALVGVALLGDTTYAGRDRVGVQRLKGRLLPAYEECTAPNVTVSCTVAAGRCVMAGELPISDLLSRIVEVSVLGVRVERGPEGGRVVTFHGGLRLPPGLRTP
jgi:hypothetical protein